MPRGRLTKVDVLSKIYKLKNSIYDNQICRDYSAEQKQAAQQILNELLNQINEYHS